MKTTSVAKMGMTASKNIIVMSELFDQAIKENSELAILAKNQQQTISKQDDQIKQLRVDLRAETVYSKRNDELREEIKLLKSRKKKKKK